VKRLPDLTVHIAVHILTRTFPLHPHYAIKNVSRHHLEWQLRKREERQIQERQKKSKTDERNKKIGSQKRNF
jgi:hypothetical protein